jgi:hypothetical protein
MLFIMAQPIETRRFYPMRMSARRRLQENMSMRTDSSLGYITPPERLWNHPWYPAMTRPSYVGYTGLPAWQDPPNAEEASNAAKAAAQRKFDFFMFGLYQIRQFRCGKPTQNKS